MKKRIAAIIIALAAALACFCIAGGAFDANDYDYSSGSDWGSSDWGSDDWGSSGSTYYYDSDSGSSGGGSGIGFAAVVVIVIVLFMILKSKSGGNSNGGSTPVGGGVRPANGGQGLRVILPDRTAEI
ncbi:MAG: hypothetical protein ACI4KR_05815, partial [Ruminiclostridium sp.]